MKRKILFIFLLLILILIGIILINAASLKPMNPEVPAVTIVPPDSAVHHLSQAVQIKTISYSEPEKFDSIQFLDFIIFLETSYPWMHENLERIIIANYGLLYTWKGTDSLLKPILLLAHLDVVPVEEETKQQWDEDPFSGKITDEFIYGRGTLDDKAGVIGICEAVEKLLSENFIPEKSIYIAFGFDEEIGGHGGAEKIADYLQRNKIYAEFVLDEGMSVTEGIIPGIEKPLALIGIAEKGYVSYELKVNSAGGHSSMPEKENAITLLSRALLKVHENPFPVRITEPTDLFLQHIGAEMPFYKKMIFANRWLFEKLIIHEFEQTKSGNACLRTTISPTIFRSGVKENLIPAEAKAVINFRILPGESPESTEKYIRNIINDTTIKISSTGIINHPSPVSSTSSKGYKKIVTSIKQVFPNTGISPALVLGATDSKHYLSISENVYRFLPVHLKTGDLERVHGINERISKENFSQCIAFYYNLLINSAGPEK